MESIPATDTDQNIKTRPPNPKKKQDSASISMEWRGWGFNWWGSVQAHGPQGGNTKKSMDDQLAVRTHWGTPRKGICRQLRLKLATTYATSRHPKKQGTRGTEKPCPTVPPGVTRLQRHKGLHQKALERTTNTARRHCDSHSRHADMGVTSAIATLELRSGWLQGPADLNPKPEDMKAEVKFWTNHPPPTRDPMQSKRMREGSAASQMPWKKRACTSTWKRHGK